MLSLGVLLLLSPLLPLAASARILNLSEGDSCRTLDGGDGRCKPLKSCRDPGDFRREQPPICAFRGLEPIICCGGGVTERLSPGIKAAKYCDEVELTCSGDWLLHETPESTRAKRSLENMTTTTEEYDEVTFNLAPPIYAGQPVLPSHQRNMIVEISRRPWVAPIAEVRRGGKEQWLYLPYLEAKNLNLRRGNCASVEMTCNMSRIAQETLTTSRNKQGLTTKEVFGGHLVRSKDHRHMVLIGYGPADNKEWGCGGSLVSQRYVLSAAHCASTLNGPATWARLGDLDISTLNDDAGNQDRRIEKRILHPDYREPQAYNDIALFKLDQDVVFTPWVAPVCLHTARTIPSGSAIVTGWGRKEFVGETSNHLLEAELDVYNDTECRRLLNFRDNKTPRGIVSDFMFCAGKSDGSKDACSGDSGGPLVVKEAGRCLKTQIGVTSYGNMCGLPDSPGVYTRVSTYIAWIEEIVFS